MGPKDRANYFPGCVHVLMRNEEEEEDGDAVQWSGRMAAIKAQVSQVKTAHGPQSSRREDREEDREKENAELEKKIKAEIASAVEKVLSELAALKAQG